MKYRLFCGLSIVVCSGLIGWELRRRMLIRLRSLEMLREYLKSVRSYVSHTGMNIEDIFFNIDKSNNGKTFNSFIKKMSEYSQPNSFQSAFVTTLSQLKTGLCLSDDDMALLSSLMDQFGCFDVDQSVSALDFADERLSLMISEARKKFESNGKLYVTSGIACGVVAALIMV